MFLEQAPLPVYILYLPPHSSPKCASYVHNLLLFWAGNGSKCVLKQQDWPMHHLPSSSVNNEGTHCILGQKRFLAECHLGSWYHRFPLQQRSRGLITIPRVSASPGSLESLHSIVATDGAPAKASTMCGILASWPLDGLHSTHRGPASCPILLPGLCEQPPMRSRRSLKGTRCCCQSAHRPRPQVGNSIWQRKEKCGTFSFLHRKRKETSKQEARHRRLAARSQGGATDLLRLVLGGEQNRVWELRTLANGEFMWRQFPPTHRPLLALHHLLCRNLSRSDLAGKTHVLNWPFVERRFLCRKPNAVKSSPTSYGGQGVVLRASQFEKGNKR